MITVPQTKELDVWNWNGVALLPLASMTRLGYAELLCVIVTPGVDVVSVAEMADSLRAAVVLQRDGQLDAFIRG